MVELHYEISTMMNNTKQLIHDDVIGHLWTYSCMNASMALAIICTSSIASNFSIQSIE